jgi:hypothetical protein
MPHKEYGINAEEFIRVTKEANPIAHLEYIAKNISEIYSILDTLFYLKTDQTLQTQYLALFMYIIYTIVWGYIFVRCSLIILIS